MGVCILHLKMHIDYKVITITILKAKVLILVCNHFVRYPISGEKAFILTGDLANFGKRFEKTLVDAGEPLNGRKKWYQLC